MVAKTFELVSYEKRSRVAWITINNAERMNALSTGVQNGLWDSFDEAMNDDDVLCLVVTGDGGRAFCAGADLREMTERDQAGGAGTAQAAKNGLSKVTECMKPVIAAIDGYALAGGMQLSSRCDFRIATESSTFGMPEPLRSLTPISMMDTQELGFMPLGEAMWIILSGEHIPGSATVRDWLPSGAGAGSGGPVCRGRAEGGGPEEVRAPGGASTQEGGSPVHEPPVPARRGDAPGPPSEGERAAARPGREERGQNGRPQGLRREASPQLEGAVGKQPAGAGRQPQTAAPRDSVGRSSGGQFVRRPTGQAGCERGEQGRGSGRCGVAMREASSRSPLGRTPTRSVRRQLRQRLGHRRGRGAHLHRQRSWTCQEPVSFGGRISYRPS